MLCEEMKVVVQNGCDHALKRKDVEIIVPLFPSSWGEKVKSIVLCQDYDSIECEYFSKQKLLQLGSPKNRKDRKGKEEAIEKLLISLSCVSDGKMLPNHLSKSEKNFYYEKTQVLREKCFNAIK
jgi:hypothetical protein